MAQALEIEYKYIVGPLERQHIIDFVSDRMTVLGVRDIDYKDYYYIPTTHRHRRVVPHILRLRYDMPEGVGRTELTYKRNVPTDKNPWARVEYNVGLTPVFTDHVGLQGLIIDGMNHTQDLVIHKQCLLIDTPTVVITYDKIVGQDIYVLEIEAKNTEYSQAIIDLNNAEGLLTLLGARTDRREIKSLYEMFNDGKVLERSK